MKELILKEIEKTKSLKNNYYVDNNWNFHIRLPL